MLMFQEASRCRHTNPGKPMTIIKFLVFIWACGSIEPCLFVAYFSAVFPTAVSYVYTTFHRHIFLQNMESFRTVSRKDIWRIIRGGQGTKRVFRGNRNGSWEQIWGISGSLMPQICSHLPSMLPMKTLLVPWPPLLIFQISFLTMILILSMFWGKMFLWKVDSTEDTVVWNMVKKDAPFLGRVKRG